MICDKLGTKPCNHPPLDEDQQPKTLIDVDGNRLVDLKTYDLFDTDTKLTAQFTSNGGDSGHEFPRNLLDHSESFGNWWSQHNSRQSWVKIDFT